MLRGWSASAGSVLAGVTSVSGTPSVFSASTPSTGRASTPSRLQPWEPRASGSHNSANAACAQSKCKAKTELGFEKA